MQQLSTLKSRLDTYEANNILTGIKNQLARAGFYYTGSSSIVKCYCCSYELDASDINPSVNVIKLHREKQPACEFAKTLNPNNPVQEESNILLSQVERLQTFIGWPKAWLSPQELAADGFYYLGTDDHCKCIFCKGIVGEWEVGDTPRGEHQRHFPHCPFVLGTNVDNVPMP